MSQTVQQCAEELQSVSTAMHIEWKTTNSIPLLPPVMPGMLHTTSGSITHLLPVLDRMVWSWWFSAGPCARFPNHLGIFFSNAMQRKLPSEIHWYSLRHQGFCIVTFYEFGNCIFSSIESVIQEIITECPKLLALSGSFHDIEESKVYSARWICTWQGRYLAWPNRCVSISIGHA